MSYLLEGLNAGTIITIVVIFLLSSSLLRRSSLVPLIKVMEKRAARGAAAQAHKAAPAERMVSARREAHALLPQAECVTDEATQKLAAGYPAPRRPRRRARRAGQEGGMRLGLPEGDNRLRTRVIPK